MVNKNTIKRYNCQENLKEIGKKGQEALHKASVFIVGIGALGTTAANLLVRAGVGKIRLCDRDIVELHDLHRQTIFTEEDCGKPKAAQAALWLRAVNSGITIGTIAEEINQETITMCLGYDLILDCTDNMETRFLINDFCLKNKIPWIYCCAVGSKGRCFVFDPENAINPCFRCLFPITKPGSLETCEITGVLSTIITTMAAVQVTEAIKVLTCQKPTEELIAYDIWNLRFEKITVKKRKDCVCCQKNRFEFLEEKKQTETVKLCGQGRVQIKGRIADIKGIEKRLKNAGKVTVSEYGLYFKNPETDLFLFNDGRCLIKATTTDEAKSVYRKYIGY